MSFPSEYPGNLHDAFHDAFYAFIEGDEFEPTVYCVNDDDQSLWLAMDPKERLMWIAGMLRHNTDTLPGDICADLDIPQGSTYAQGCEKILRGEIDPEEYE